MLDEQSRMFSRWSADVGASRTAVLPVRMHAMSPMQATTAGPAVDCGAKKGRSITKAGCVPIQQSFPRALHLPGFYRLLHRNRHVAPSAKHVRDEFGLGRLGAFNDAEVGTHSRNLQEDDHKQTRSMLFKKGSRVMSAFFRRSGCNSSLVPRRQKIRDENCIRSSPHRQTDSSLDTLSILSSNVSVKSDFDSDSESDPISPTIKSNHSHISDEWSSILYGPSSPKKRVVVSS